ncbi:MAG: hypothetical protein ACK4UP_12255 [Spirosomataceae bacterium]
MGNFHSHWRTHVNNWKKGDPENGNIANSNCDFCDGIPVASYEHIVEHYFEGNNVRVSQTKKQREEAIGQEFTDAGGIDTFDDVDVPQNTSSVTPFAEITRWDAGCTIKRLRTKPNHNPEETEEEERELVHEIIGNHFESTEMREGAAPQPQVRYDNELDKELFARSVRRIEESVASVKREDPSLPTFPNPLMPRPNYAPFSCIQQVKYTIRKYIIGKLPDAEIRQDLKEIHVDNNPTNAHMLFPSSLDDMKLFVKLTPKLEAFAPANSPKSVRYRIKDILANVLNDENLKDDFIFCENHSHEFVDEMFKSQGWNKFFLYTAPDELPIVILLFYDDMAKYRFAPSKMGGLYMAVINMRRDLLSQLDNIHCVGLIHDESKLHEIQDELVDEFIALFNPHLAQTKFGKVKVRTFLGIYLADTPQRNETAYMKAPNATCQCMHCMSQRDHNSTILKKDHEYIVRDVPKMRELFQIWLSKPTMEQKDEFAKLKGLNPRLRDGEYVENSFYKLYDKYKFDIHADSPVEFLHVGIIGLYAAHVEVMYQSLKKSERRDFKLAYHEMKLNGRTMRKWGTRGYWMGEEWLAFLAVAPFVADKLLPKRENNQQSTAINVSHERLKLLLIHSKWMRILLQRTISIKEIDEAEKIFFEWRRGMITVYRDTNLIKYSANFHNIIHVFQFARRWGSPILYW